jgi:ribose 5-phosphate isomerase A
LSDRSAESLRKIAHEIGKKIRGDISLGLGSGRTVALVFGTLFPDLTKREIKVTGIPTSIQIETVARRYGIPLGTFGGPVDLVVDGADQVDRKLNLVKGGGGALLREKILIYSSRKTCIVIDNSKFVDRVGTKNQAIPVEIAPFARDTIKERLHKIGGISQERLLKKGYPYFTENGNMILDTRFHRISDPERLEREVKSIPGVIEVGLFTRKHLTIYLANRDGSFESVGAT